MFLRALAAVFLLPSGVLSSTVESDGIDVDDTSRDTFASLLLLLRLRHGDALRLNVFVFVTRPPMTSIARQCLTMADLGSCAATLERRQGEGDPGSGRTQ